MSGRDLVDMDTGELLEQIAFLRAWAGAVQILAIAEPRATAKGLDNPILRLRQEALEEELRHRRQRFAP